MGLGQAHRGRQAAHEADGNGDGVPDQLGFYTETGDMENFWLSTVWQNGGDVLAPDGKSTVLDTDEAAAAIQFVQDLIWKDKVMPDPAVSADDRRRLRAEAGRHGGQRLVAGAHVPGR